MRSGALPKKCPVLMRAAGFGAAQAAWGGDTVDKICHLRLHENEIMQFFTLYQLECGEGLPSLRYADFCRVFKKDKRLAHIGVARKRDNFGECSKCTAFKQLVILEARSVA
jgi:hypothetical protein